MAAATKWKSFIAEFVKSQFSRSKQTPEALPHKRFADIRSLHGADADSRGRTEVRPTARAQPNATLSGWSWD